MHVACMGENAYKGLVENLDGKGPLGTHRRSFKTILKWILGKYDGLLWM
jgi:hypothetical protein